MKLTKELAQKVRDTVDAGLTKGLGRPKPGQMCVEAAVNYAMGLPHNDNPMCVGGAVRRFKITLNDSNLWSSNTARAKGLRRVAIAQLGSDKLDQRAFVNKLMFETIKQIIPIAMRNTIVKSPHIADEFERLAIACEVAVNLDTAKDASRNAYAAYAYNNHTDYANRVNFAVYGGYSNSNFNHYIKCAFVSNPDHESVPADTNAADAAAAASNVACTSSNRDKILTLSAEIAVQVLIEMGCQGCEWLDLVPLSESE